MITISDKAAQRISDMNSQQSSTEKTYVRVSVSSGGCSGLTYNLEFDSISKEGDQFFESNGHTLICDKKSFFYLIGTELDFSEGLSGKGFQFVNPNATRTCACGESFSL